MWRAASAFGLLALAACERPRPLVICHNGNCISPDVRRDDTVEALQQSLALRYEGLPVLDGVELDLFWYGNGERCIFAHDLAGALDVPAEAAATTIADYLAATPRPSWNGERFYVFFELKGHVGPAFADAHDEAQLVQHAECGLDAMEIVAAGANAGSHQVTIGFTSVAPRLLDALVARPRWPGRGGEPEVLLVGDIFTLYSAEVPDLADYRVALDAIEYHPDVLTDGHREAYESLGLDLIQWSFTTSVEALDAIERHRPRWVLTNDAVLLRRWITR